MAAHRANDARILDILIDISAECPSGRVTAGRITNRHSHFLSGRRVVYLRKMYLSPINFIIFVT